MNYFPGKSTAKPLTAKEKTVLEFIESFLKESGGIAPSYQEIKEHFGFASFNSVQRYLKQLQSKNYISIPGGNQKRAISLLQSAQTISESLLQLETPQTLTPNPFVTSTQTQSGGYTAKVPHAFAVPPETLSIPLYGRVAAGQPIEALEYNEFVEAPPNLLRFPQKCFALKVEGQSMIEDGILDGDFIFVQQQSNAINGDIVVATVDNEATVKRIYFPKQHQKQHGPKGQLELRPANSNMESMWYSPEHVDIKGIVVGLLRKYI